MEKKLSKKEFKDGCNEHVYGKGQTKRNAIYYGEMLDNDGNWRGFQYMIKAQVCQCKLQELRNMLYLWVTGETDRPFCVETKYANTIEEAFKVSIMG